MRDRTLALGLGCALAYALAGCSEGSDEPTGTIGEAGYGVFHYECLTEGDAVCNVGPAVDSQAVSAELGTEGQIPKLVAVGARFDLDFTGVVPYDDYGEPLPLEIVPARDDIVSTTGGFSFSEAAEVAFLARNPRGISVDFINVTADDADDLELWWNERQVTSFELAQPGAESALAVVPIAAAGVHLGGAFDYTWSSSNETVVALAPIGSVEPPQLGLVIHDDEVRVVALSEGVATVRVELEGWAKEVTVTVGPEVTP